MTSKRLKSDTWKKIEKHLQDPTRNMSKIARKFHVSRNSLYIHAYTRNLIEKDKKRNSFWKDFKNEILKRFNKIKHFT